MLIKIKTETQNVILAQHDRIVIIKNINEYNVIVADCGTWSITKEEAESLVNKIRELE